MGCNSCNNDWNYALCSFWIFYRKAKFFFGVSSVFCFRFINKWIRCVLYPMVLELFHPSAGSPISGSLNCFGFISLIIFMPLTGKVLQIFGTLPENPKIHNPYGFSIFVHSHLELCFFSFLKIKKKVENTFNSVENYDVIK